jgi:multidrug resistance efflux pump
LEGTLRALKCKNGEKVAKGQVLAEVESADLQAKQNQLRAEVAAAEQKLEVLTAQKDKAPNPMEAGRLAIELEQTRTQWALRRDELTQLTHRTQGGKLLAPLDGTVVFPDKEPAVGRVVSGAEALLSVVNLEGDWSAVVDFAEADVGRLLRTVRGAKDKRLEVDLLPTALPGQPLKGVLHAEDIALAVRREGTRTVLTAKVRPTPEALKELRQLPIGSTVTARCVCP